MANNREIGHPDSHSPWEWAGVKELHRLIVLSAVILMALMAPRLVFAQIDPPVRTITVRAKVELWDEGPVEGYLLYAETANRVHAEFTDPDGTVVFTLEVMPDEDSVMVGRRYRRDYLYYLKDESFPAPPEIVLTEDQRRFHDELLNRLRFDYIYPFPPITHSVPVPIREDEDEYEIVFRAERAAKVEVQLTNTLTGKPMDSAVTVRHRYGQYVSVTKKVGPGRFVIGGIPPEGGTDIYFGYFPFYFIRPVPESELQKERPRIAAEVYLNWDDSGNVRDIRYYIDESRLEGRRFDTLTFVIDAMDALLGQRGWVDGGVTLIAPDALSALTFTYRFRSSVTPYVGDSFHTHQKFPWLPFGEYYVIPASGFWWQENPYPWLLIDAIRAGIDLSDYNIPRIEITDGPERNLIQFNALIVMESLDRLKADMNWSPDDPPIFSPEDHQRRTRQRDAGNDDID